MKKFAYISLSLLTFSVVGCNIEVNEGYSDDWDEDSSLSERAEAECQSYCLRLIECSVVADGAFQACTDLCVDRYVEDEETVSEGCECVSSSSCDDDEIRQCPGDPIPGVWDDDDDDVFGDGDGDGDTTSAGDGDGDGDTTSAGDGDGDGETTAGGAPNDPPDGTACTVNHECAIGEDCVDQQCLPRCAASCQCADGQACEEGYCRTPQEPVAQCEDTCDCTAGDECVSGVCM